jgi:chromate transporter
MWLVILPMRRPITTVAVLAVVSGAYVATRQMKADIFPKLGADVALGRRAISDWQTGAVAIVTFIGLLATQKLPEPLLIIAAGMLGLLLQRGTHS